MTGSAIAHDQPWWFCCMHGRGVPSAFVRSCAVLRLCFKMFLINEEALSDIIELANRNGHSPCSGTVKVSKTALPTA